MKNLKELEIKDQTENKKELIFVAEYNLSKWVYNEDQFKKRLEVIEEQFKNIIQEILSDKNIKWE